MGLNRVFGIWGGGDSWDLFCLIFKLQIVMLQDWRLQGCYRHGFSLRLRGEIELTGTRQSGIENCTVGENAFLWSLASKSSWLTAVLQSPRENHFWRKWFFKRPWCMWHQALNYLWKSEAFHSRAAKEEKIRGPCSLCFWWHWWDTTGCGGEVQSNDHRQRQQTKSWGGSASALEA